VWRGSIIFAITYLLISGRRFGKIPMDRPSSALIGAVLAVAIGALTPEEASAAVDKNTIMLLFAVMGMGAFLSLDGVFDRAAPWLVTRTHSRAGLLAALVWGAGILSAFITNDAVCVLGAPVVVTWIRRWQLPRLPFLLALATASNTGSVATLVGNPQNMLCAHLGALSFRTYFGHMLPVAVLGLALNHAILHLMFRAELQGELPQEPFRGAVFSRGAVITLGVLAVTVTLYSLGANLTFTALAGFVLLLLLHRVDPAEVWARVDWSILLFFGGLFVAVDAFARSGVAAWVFAHVPLFVGPEGVGAYLRTGTYFLLGSNVVTNVPFILIVRAEVERLPDPKLAWELLAMASTFAGNLTLLGSVANVIVAEKAKSEGGLRFLEYMKVGFPVALLTTLMGTVWLVLVH
jgi:Na+/H+ antiporter NhaD/arsenite permease-like protein